MMVSMTCEIRYWPSNQRQSSQQKMKNFFHLLVFVLRHTYLLWVSDWEAFDLAVQRKGNLCLKFAASALLAGGKLSLCTRSRAGTGQDAQGTGKHPSLIVIYSCALENLQVLPMAEQSSPGRTVSQMSSCTLPAMQPHFSCLWSPLFLALSNTVVQQTASKWPHSFAEVGEMIHCLYIDLFKYKMMLIFFFQLFSIYVFPFHIIMIFKGYVEYILDQNTN